MPKCPSTSTRRCRTRAQVPKYSKVFFGVVSPVGSWPVTGVTSSNLQWQLMPRNWTRCRSVPGNSQYTSNSGDCWSWLQMPLTHQCQIADMHRPLRVFQCRSWFLLGSWEAWIYIYMNISRHSLHQSSLDPWMQTTAFCAPNGCSTAGCGCWIKIEASDSTGGQEVPWAPARKATRDTLSLYNIILYIYA